MNNKMPRTPFSTQLSGSARETEIRLKNIFSGPKKRPPILFLALMFSVCVFCGNLVSCQLAQAETPDDPIQQNDPQQGDVSILDGQGVPVDVDYSTAKTAVDLLQALFQAANEQEAFQVPEARLLASIQGDNCILGAAFVTDHLENTLILGVMNQETKELDGPVFRCGQHAGAPNVVIFQNHDGEDCLLYTLNGQMMGQYRGQAGVVRFDGKNIVWQWPVEGDVRDEAGTVRQEYENYWNGHLALMAPGGVDIYTVNPEFEWGGEEPWSMWQLETGEVFYTASSSAAELPMPVYFQSLRWLNEHTNDPGGWQIVSLTLDGERSDAESMPDCFTLRARSWDSAEELTADLFFSYEQDGGRRSYSGLDHAEVRDKIHE